MLSIVISGAQTGADIAGLRAAKECGFETGGWMPAGCETTEGPHPDWLVEFGLQEHSGGYKDRTWSNVQAAGATVRLAARWDSPGERCTLRAIQRYGRRYMDIDLNSLVTPRSALMQIEAFVTWIASFDDRLVLNVAGNSESTYLGAYSKSYHFLLEAFSRIKRGQSARIL